VVFPLWNSNGGTEKHKQPKRRTSSSAVVRVMWHRNSSQLQIIWPAAFIITSQIWHSSCYSSQLRILDTAPSAFFYEEVHIFCISYTFSVEFIYSHFNSWVISRLVHCGKLSRRNDLDTRERRGTDGEHMCLKRVLNTQSSGRALKPSSAPDRPSYIV
jgi:hypothetical protein